VVGAAWGEGGAKVATVLQKASDVGSPWITGFAYPGEIAELLKTSGSGFAVTEDVSMWELSEKHLAPLGRAVAPASKFAVERFAIAVVGPKGEEA